MAEGRLLGLGWKFGTKGSEKTTREVSGIADQTERLDGAMKSVGITARMSKLGAFVESVSMKRLGDISNQMDNIAQAAGAPQITTNLEQTMLQMGKTTKVIGAGMGLTGKELAKFQSQAANVAYALDGDVETIAQAMRYAKNVTVDVSKDMGMSWMDMGKASQVYGIEAEKIIEINKSLKDSYSLGAVGAKRAMDQTVALAQKFGFGDKALQAMDISMQAIDSQFAETLGRESPEAVEKTLRAITGLGMVMTKTLGGEPADNIQQAADLFKQLSGSTDQFAQLKSGLVGDIPDFMDKMTVAGINVDNMFDLMKKDPAEFALSLRKMTVKMESMGASGEISGEQLNRFHNLMVGMPPQFKFLMQASDELAPSLDQLLTSVVAPSEDATDAMKKMANAGFTTGRSLEEQLTRIKDRFETTFHRISRPEMQAFVGRMRKGYDSLGKKMKEVAGEGGPLGTFIKGWSAFKQGGIAAAIGVMKGPNAPVTALDMIISQAVEISGQAIPAFTALGSMGLKFRHFGLPLMPITKTLGLFNTALGGMPGKLLGILGPIGLVITAIGAFGGGLGETFKEIGRKVPEYILKYVFGMEGLEKKVAKQIGPMASMIPGEIMDEIGKAAGEKSSGDLWLILGKKVWGALEKAFTWASDNFGRGVDILWGGLKSGLGLLWDKLTDWWNDPSKSFIDKAKDLGKSIGIALGAGLLLSGAFRSWSKNILGRFMGLRKNACMESQAMGSCVSSGVMGGGKYSPAGVPAAGVIGGRTFDYRNTPQGYATGLSEQRNGLGATGSHNLSGGTSIQSAVGGTMGPGLAFLNQGPTKQSVGMFKKMGGLFNKVGGRLKVVGSRAFGAAKGMGRMAAMAGGAALLSGQFDPLIEKLGVTSHGADLASKSMGGALIGFSAAGPWGALIGGLVGAFAGLYKAFTDNKFAAENMGVAMKGYGETLNPAMSAMIDWDAEARTNTDMMRMQEKQTGLLATALYNLSPAYKAVTDAQNLMLSAEALKSRKEFSTGFLAHFKNLRKQGISSIKMNERQIRETKEGFIGGLQAMEPKLKQAADNLEAWRYAEGEQGKLMRKKYGGELLALTNDIKTNSSLLQQYLPTAWTEVGTKVEAIQGRLSRSTALALESMDKSGEKSKDKMVGKSWGTDIARGWDSIGIAAAAATSDTSSAVKALGAPANPVKGNVVFKPKDNKVTAGGAEGTRELIMVVSRGFTEVVNTLKEMARISNASELKSISEMKKYRGSSKLVMKQVSDDMLAGYR